MSGKKRFQKPGSLQPNIDDILEWSKLPEDAFDAASSQEKADFIKDRKSVSYWADAWRRLRKNKVAMVALAIIIAWLFSDLWDRALFHILTNSRCVVPRHCIRGIIHWKTSRRSMITWKRKIRLQT